LLAFASNLITMVCASPLRSTAICTITSWALSHCTMQKE
jgi:hypothetical protein